MPHDDSYIPDVSPVSGVPSNHGTYFLGRYRIIDEIGLGGMASVHLARVDGIGGFQRWFAVKRIHAHLVEDETFVNMFLDEANVAARIQHPNVATVFELGRHDDTYWIAMEYLHGEPLREVMRRTEEMGTTMPPEIACRVIAEAADGLHAAHELQGKNGEKLNLIHRDVTPHNLFVTYDGTTKVVDFGIAKFQDRMASTQAGTLKGKLAYMSPEQVAGENIDRRTDIFALGVVLWELTTGQRLFRMDSDLDTLAKVQECNIPPPSTMVRGYPLDLEKILMQALAKKREDRFPTAREFSRALQSLLTRRGLFIAQDEVAAYMGSIFSDRIAKREEHLRWANAVSDAAAAAAAASGPASAAPPAPPAPPAPLPPRVPTRTMQPPPVAPAPPPPRAATPAPPPAAPRPAAAAAPRPAAGAPARAIPYGGPPPSVTGAQMNPPLPLPRPPTVSYGSPGPAQKPAAGASPQRGGASYPLPPPPRAAQPDDDDADRTVQATAAQQAAARASDEDREDRTVQATAAQQASAQAGYDFNDDDDEGDATIVSRTPPGEAPSPPSIGPPVGMPAILPAAGSPAQRRPAPAPAPPPPAPAPPPPQSAARLGVGAAARTMPLVAGRQGTAAPQARPGTPPPPVAAPAPMPAFPPPPDAAGPTMPPAARGGQQPPWGPPAGPPPFAPSGGYAAPGSYAAPGGGYGPPPQLGPPSGNAPQGPQMGAAMGGAAMGMAMGAAGAAMGAPNGQPGANLGPPVDFGQNGYPPPPMTYGAPPYPTAPNQPQLNPSLASTVFPEAARAPTREVIRPKRIPAWAVAVASGLIALVLAGAAVLVYAVFLRGAPKPVATKPAVGQGAPGGSAGPGGSATPAASAAQIVGAGTGGLFSSARMGFLAVATPTTSANTGAGAPAAGSASAAAATPPAASDTATAAAPPPPATSTAVAAADPTPAPAPADPTPPPPQAVAAAPTRSYDPPPAANPTPAPTPRYSPPAAAAAAPQPTSNAKGFLNIICIPGCDRVELDGSPLGGAPIFRRQTGVGSHRIKLVSSNPPATKYVNKVVVADTTTTVRESMP